jgi:hypothetical protein
MEKYTKMIFFYIYFHSHGELLLLFLNKSQSSPCDLLPIVRGGSKGAREQGSKGERGRGRQASTGIAWPAQNQKRELQIGISDIAGVSNHSRLHCRKITQTCAGQRKCYTDRGLFSTCWNFKICVAHALSVV